jgi:hypothetical protein
MSLRPRSKRGARWAPACCSADRASDTSSASGGERSFGGQEEEPIGDLAVRSGGGGFTAHSNARRGWIRSFGRHWESAAEVGGAPVDKSAGDGQPGPVAALPYAPHPSPRPYTNYDTRTTRSRPFRPTTARRAHRLLLRRPSFIASCHRLEPAPACFLARGRPTLPPTCPWLYRNRRTWHAARKHRPAAAGRAAEPRRPCDSGRTSKKSCHHAGSNGNGNNNGVGEAAERCGRAKSAAGSPGPAPELLPARLPPRPFDSSTGWPRCCVFWLRARPRRFAVLAVWPCAASWPSARRAVSTPLSGSAAATQSLPHPHPGRRTAAGHSSAVRWPFADCIHAPADWVAPI